MFSSPEPPPDALFTVILLRHGESVGNAEGYHQGQFDFPLTDNGRRQARALGRRWRREGLRFDAVITSPLLRARETADIIASLLEAPLEIDEDWMERDNGLLSGLRPEESAQVVPRPAFIHPYQAIGQTGESQWELYLRAGRALQRLLLHPQGCYLVISHGGILNMAMYAILGIPVQANFTGPRFRFGNTAFATFSYHPAEHKWTLHGLNDRSHWTGPITP